MSDTEQFAAKSIETTRRRTRSPSLDGQNFLRFARRITEDLIPEWFESCPEQEAKAGNS